MICCELTVWLCKHAAHFSWLIMSKGSGRNSSFNQLVFRYEWSGFLMENKFLLFGNAASCRQWCHPCSLLQQYEIFSWHLFRYFLKEGYAVIFLHRSNSLKPFSRHFKEDGILEYLVVSKEEHPAIKVREEDVPKVLPTLEAYGKSAGQLLLVPFTTLVDYLYLLRASSQSLSLFKRRALLYLAAAVSDFYIPAEQMVTLQTGFFFTVC